jgi:hypothetical protein
LQDAAVAEGPTAWSRAIVIASFVAIFNDLRVASVCVKKVMFHGRNSTFSILFARSCSLTLLRANA